jgi:hypothetical protein
MDIEGGVCLCIVGTKVKDRRNKVVLDFELDKKKDTR